MSVPVTITDEQVEKLLDWDELIQMTEDILVSLTEGSSGGVNQELRTVTELPPNNGIMISMPGYSAKHGALTMKILCVYLENAKKNLPSQVANVFYFDEKTGELKAIIDGGVLTGRRTAAASVVATKALLESTPKILAILGCGVEGHAHAEAFSHIYKFSEIRIWNRSIDARKTLANKLICLGENVIQCDSVKETALSADIICTTTSAEDHFLHDDCVKNGAIINAIGAPFNGSEISPTLFKKCLVVADYKHAAETECRFIQENNISIYASIGEVISGKKPRIPGKTIIFKSQGIGAEDAISAKIIFENYKKANSRFN